MASNYPNEISFIRTAREQQPNVPAKTLARDLVGTGPLPSCRTFYSIYSVIRRYDASKKNVGTKKLAKTAKTATKALQGVGA